MYSLFCEVLLDKVRKFAQHLPGAYRRYERGRFRLRQTLGLVFHFSFFAPTFFFLRTASSASSSSNRRGVGWVTRRVRRAEDPAVKQLRVSYDFIRGECAVKRRLHASAQGPRPHNVSLGNETVAFHLPPRLAVRPARQFPAQETRGDEARVQIVVRHWNVRRVAVTARQCCPLPEKRQTKRVVVEKRFIETEARAGWERLCTPEVGEVIES
jgi:hypothetical protein